MTIITTNEDRSVGYISINKFCGREITTRPIIMIPVPSSYPGTRRKFFRFCRKSFPGDIRKQAAAASLSDGVDELHSGAFRSKDFQGL